MLNISKQVVVAFDSTNDGLPFADVIPLGESKKEKLILEKVSQKYNQISELDNVPLPGFTLNSVNRKTWSYKDRTWTVIDPRGFLVSISSKNLEDILKVTGITEGLIQQKCVWAKQDDDVNLTLLPISSSKYKEAVENTILIEQKVDIKDVKIGDRVLLQNTLVGRYMGVYSLYGCMQEGMAGFKVAPKLRKHVVEVSPGKFHYGSDVKVLKIIEKSKEVLTRDDCAAYMNNLIDTGVSYFTIGTNFTRGYYGNFDLIKHVSPKAVTKVNVSLEEIDISEATKLLISCRAMHDNGCLVVESATGDKFVTVYPWLSSAHSPDKFSITQIVDILDDRFDLIGSKNHSYMMSSRLPDQKLANFKKFYKIVKTVKGNSYI